jgi:hypothetical protein
MSVIQQNHNDTMRIPSPIMEKADQMHFALHWSDDGIVAGVFDIATKQPIWLKHQAMQPWEFSQNIREWKWNQPLFRKVSITHCAKEWTLCPQHLFDPSQLAAWLPAQAQCSTEFHFIQNQNMVLIEQFVPLAADIPLLFSNVKQNSIVDHWLHFHLSQHLGQDHLTIIVESGLIAVILQKKGSLVLANQFAGSQPEDVLYFASAVLQQNLMSQETAITLVGRNANPALKAFFEPYFIQVNLWQPPVGLHLPKDHEACDWHSILLHTLCAS